MSTLEIVVALAILVGLVGAVVQIYPGSIIVLAAVAVWGVVTGGAVGWSVAAAAVVFVVAAGILKYVYAGKYLARAGVPNRAMLIGGVLGVIGFFVIPVIGLPIGFVLGVFLAELERHRGAGEAWRSTLAAIKATGLAIFIELAGALLAAGAWVVGVLLT